MDSWYETIFGEKPIRQRLPILIIEPGETVEVTCLSDHPRVVATRHGTRAVIDVEAGGEQYALFLSAKSLARPFAIAEAEKGSLRGVTFRVTRPKGTEESRYYRVELVE